MSNNTTTDRRDVLKAIGTVSMAGGLSTVAAAADRVRVVEAGLRYEVPDNDDYVEVHPDSRPPYTVNDERGRLLVLNTASARDRSHIRGASELANERSVQTGARVRVGPRDGKLDGLPTSLTARMRPKRVVNLDSPVRAPTVAVHPNADGVVLEVESRGTTDLPVGERTTVSLDPLRATARTTHVVGEASVDGVPDHMQGLERRYDSVEIEVTPVVEAINHGELQVKQQPDPSE